MVEKVGLVPILRAGLGMVEGAWDLLPQAEVWHLGLYRDERTLKPVSYYNKLPVAPTVELCLVLDPMLATGGSAIAAVQVLKEWGVSRIKFVGLVAAPAGVEALHSHFPDVAVHVAAVDERLTGPGDEFPSGYIWPGLGRRRRPPVWHCVNRTKHKAPSATKALGAFSVVKERLGASTTPVCVGSGVPCPSA